jgi:hypothetical protein
MRRLTFTFPLIISSASLFAQNASLVWDGRRATVRISEITSTGTAKGFMDAVAAHREWVLSHGFTKDEIITVPVIDRDEKTHTRSYSESSSGAFISTAQTTLTPKHDAAYDAFVNMYRDNSDIKSSYAICLLIR